MESDLERIGMQINRKQREEFMKSQQIKKYQMQSQKIHGVNQYMQPQYGTRNRLLNQKVMRNTNELLGGDRSLDQPYRPTGLGQSQDVNQNERRASRQQSAKQRNQRQPKSSQSFQNQLNIKNQSQLNAQTVYNLFKGRTENKQKQHLDKLIEQNNTLQQHLTLLEEQTEGNQLQKPSYENNGNNYEQKYKLKRLEELGVQDISSKDATKNSKTVEYPKILRNLEEYEKLLQKEQNITEKLEREKYDYNVNILRANAFVSKVEYTPKEYVTQLDTVKTTIQLPILVAGGIVKQPDDEINSVASGDSSQPLDEEDKIQFDEIQTKSIEQIINQDEIELKSFLQFNIKRRNTSMLQLRMILLEKDADSLQKRANSYSMGHKCLKIYDEEYSEKGDAKKRKKVKLNPLIKGNFKGNPFKISRTSKFIASTEIINHTLHKQAMTQVKKDANQHGTYSVNPFAMYPKHLKNTISSLLQSNAATLISTKELQKNFDNAFIDLEKREKEMKNQDMKIREKQLQLEQAEKKRYYVSQYLDKSFYIKHIFEVWYSLHQIKAFDRIQSYLQNVEVSANFVSKSDLNVQMQPQMFDYYNGLKQSQKNFKRIKDMALRELNQKYNHPNNLSFFYHMKKPAMFGKLEELKKYENKVLEASLEQFQIAQDSSPEKVVSNDDLLDQELSFKDSIKFLDEKKRKIFMNYKRWKFSLQNQKNVNFQEVHQLLMKHDEEYQACSVSQPYLIDQNLPYGGKRKSLSRIQSAKSSNH